MKKILFGIVVCALALAGCGSDTFFDEPEETIVHTPPDNDPALEKLETNVGYYYGDKGVDLTRIEFAYRAAGQYCIFPRTEARTQQLAQLSQQEGYQIQQIGYYFLVTGDRDLITDNDYVSDRYFVGYYENEPEFLMIGPGITVSVADPKTKDKILKTYRGKLIESTNSEQGHVTWNGDYLYRFDCSLKTSEQVMNLADKLYRRDDVTWAEASMYMPIHLH